MSDESKSGEGNLLAPEQIRNGREAFGQRPDEGIWLGFLIVVGMYAFSFCLPAVDVMGEPLMGWQAFWLAPNAFLQEGEFREGLTMKDKIMAALTWLPNPLLWIAVVLWLKRSRRGAALFAFHATWIALLWVVQFETATFHVHHLSTGYFLWVGSAASLVIMSVIRAIADRNAGNLRCDSSTL